ncbi:hypothetical protein KIL84_018227 [Mauremys mutica]|uniref:Uncharacterized protein n=1 Tax=Mauremys mutica TaxID=74926 RepID=A0A9D3XSU4_9SAUR|nr:hypothetical protein KIL84_018227 [Mauremys mutica]
MGRKGYFCDSWMLLRTVWLTPGKSPRAVFLCPRNQRESALNTRLTPPSTVTPEDPDHSRSFTELNGAQWMQESGHWEQLAGASFTSGLLLFIIMGVCATLANSEDLLRCPGSEFLF